MRLGRALVPTLKEAPADATSASHVLLARAGYLRRIGAGIYGFLPLGVRVLRRIERIVREEMDRSGAEEVLLPALLPAEYLRETGRWDRFGETLFRIRDRKGADYCLGPTHEEIVTDLARHLIRSYRELPKTLYQIQTKFRDEPRPRGGLLRTREFSMKDAYSFDVSEEAARRSYDAMRSAYARIFDRMDLEYRIVNADSGAMGGSASAEFQALVHSGEDQIAACTRCDYAANVEVAEAAPARGSAIDSTSDTASVPACERVATPGKGSIADVAEFLGARADRFLKSLVYVADGVPVLAIVRGDHDVNDVKLARALGVSEVVLANADVVVRATGAAVGFAGPVGYNGRVVVDRDAAGVHDAITGANETDAHLLHVVMGRDFSGEVASIRSVRDGDACPECRSALALYRGIEAGHVFLLGTHYSAVMGANYLDEHGAARPLVMGCYGIGISRLLATLVEQHHDDDGIRWPIHVAPYRVHVVQIGEAAASTVSALENALESSGIDVLVDDRDERPGVKFKDADLIGIPLRVTVGGKSLANGCIELKLRSERDPKRAEAIAVAEGAKVVAERVRELEQACRARQGE